MLRYRSEGELHKDFHGLMCATLHYVRDRYGDDAVRAILASTAQKVYKSIHDALCAGDCSELAEHWKYYMAREGADFSCVQAFRRTEPRCMMFVYRDRAKAERKKAELIAQYGADVILDNLDETVGKARV